VQDIEKRFAACAAGKGRSYLKGACVSRRVWIEKRNFIPDSTDSRGARK